MNPTMEIQLFHECRGEHAHAYPQILVPLESPLSVSMQDSTYIATPQELLFIPAYMQHCCDYQGKLLVINLSQTELDSSETLMLTYPLCISMEGQIIRLVELIRTERKQNPDSSSIRYLYSYLYSKLLEHSAPPSIRYINEHYQEPITVYQLAKMESYNVTYYNDWFKQQTGVSPIHYLRCLRINRAKELLSSTSYSVMEIALLVGYSCNSTFTRAFHNVTGMTPKEYRDAS
ncbi:MAG: AraC family transcriptional regulator [Butyricicoccus sp.]